MVKAPSKSVKRERVEEIEIEPGAWPRFERFIRDVAKAGPQHRQTPKSVTPKRPKSKKEAADG